MPYPTEHAARLVDPSGFDRFARQNDKFGDGVHAIWGIKDGKAHLQAIRFDKSKFSVDEAKSWLKSHDYSPKSFEPASNKTAKNSYEDGRCIELIGMEIDKYLQR